MPLEIRIRRPFWLVRAIFGAAIAVLGIFLLRSYSEGLGFVLILTGVVIGVRGTFRPIVIALFCILYVGVTVTYFYWTVPEEYDYGFVEWFSENWWMYAWTGILIVGYFFSVYRRNSDAWKALRASYSGGPEAFGDKDVYPSRSGLLRIEEDFVEVHVIPGRDGIFIAKENDGHIIGD